VLSTLSNLYDVKGKAAAEKTTVILSLAYPKYKDNVRAVETLVDRGRGNLALFIAEELRSKGLLHLDAKEWRHYKKHCNRRCGKDEEIEKVERIINKALAD
jgi:hypothetical protein